MRKNNLIRILAAVLCVSVSFSVCPGDVCAAGLNWNSIKDKADDARNKAVESAGKAKDQAAEMAGKAKDQAADLAGTAKDGIVEAYNQSAAYISDVVTQIDVKKFQKGWDTAAKYVSAGVAAQYGSNYVKSVQNAISDAQKNIYSTVNSNSTLASNTGFVAEEWATGTFNINAVAGGSKLKAERPASNAKASADVQIKKGGKVVQEIGSKYYKEATKSAKAQSKTIIQNYNEYLVNAEKSGKPIMSLNEYIDKNVKLKDAYKILDSEYASEYAGQTRLIPADQLEDAAAYLRKKIAKESTKDGANRQALAKSYQETLDHLADKIEEGGIQSVPLTEDEAKALVDLCEKGDFDIEDFKGLKTSQIIKPKYILKQSMMAGGQSAALEVALTVGPDIYKIIAEGIRNGAIDEKQLKEAGVDAAFAGANGFVEGSVSSAILTACQAGKFGAISGSISPEIVGTMTVLTIDSIKYGYKLSKGEITADQYGDLLAEEIFVAIMSNASGAMLQMLLPCIPCAYLAGSMVGGMIASAAYETGKEVVLQVAAGNGFEAIIPESVGNVVNVGKETVESVDIKKVSADLKNSAISTTKAGMIKIAGLR